MPSSILALLFVSFGNLATVVIGGIISSTILTLLVLPALYRMSTTTGLWQRARMKTAS